MNDTRELFERVLADEPPLRLTVEPVVAAGRRVRRRRRVAYAACSLSLVAVAAAGVPLLLRDTAAVAPLRPVESDPALTPDQRRVARTIVDGSPGRLTFEMEPDAWTGIAVAAVAGDEGGQGRVSVMPHLPDSSDLPCAVAGRGHSDAVCAEVTLQDGSVVSIATVGNRMEVHGTLERPDGTGILVRTLNYMTEFPRPWNSTAPPRTLIRDEPLYTQNELVRLLRALDPVFRDLQS